MLAAAALAAPATTSAPSSHAAPLRDKAAGPAGRRTACVSVHVPVESYLVSVTIASTSADEVIRLQDLEKADRQLHDAPPKGTVILDNPIPDVLPEENPDIERISTPSTKDGAVVRTIVVPINKSSSALTVVEVIKEYLRMTKWPPRVAVEVRGLMAAVKDPEQYRVAVLKLIAQDIAQVREALGPTARITLEGLQNPLRTRLVTDKEADLVLDYQMSVELK